MRKVFLTEDTKKDILNNLLKRSPNNYGEYQATVETIVNEVKETGDEALFSQTKKFDKADLTSETIKVTEEEIAIAYEKVDKSLLEIIRKAIVNIDE